jgi:ketosteroid isomerase-like protein
MASDRQVIEQVYERWNRNDGDLALDFFHPEVEVHQMGRMFDTAGDFRGHEGLLKSAEELRDAYETIIWKPERWREAGDYFVVWLDGVGRGAHSGIELTVPMAHLWRVEDGLVTVFHVYETEEQALEACG